MPTINIPEKICPHCGGTKWYFAAKQKTYSCFIKAAERKIKWQRDNYEKYSNDARERRAKFRELNPLQPRSKMSDDERRAKQREFKRKKWREDAKFREDVVERVKKYELSLTPEERRLRYKKYYNKNVDKIKEYNRLTGAKMRENLCEGYLKFLITQFTDLNFKDVPEDLVELKRKQLLLKRQIKQIKQS